MDGTYWNLSISSYDGINISGYSIIYWQSHPEGKRADFTGTFNNASKEIVLFEDKGVKGAGMFSGTVSDGGRKMSGDWRRYTDNGTYLWDLTKNNN
ncbi:hypothetical protein BH10BAC5_BH10BAC5_25700 [soil metagenome]